MVSCLVVRHLLTCIAKYNPLHETPLTQHSAYCYLLWLNIYSRFFATSLPSIASLHTTYTTAVPIETLYHTAILTDTFLFKHPCPLFILNFVLICWIAWCAPSPQRHRCSITCSFTSHRRALHMFLLLQLYHTYIYVYSLLWQPLFYTLGLWWDRHPLLINLVLYTRHLNFICDCFDRFWYTHTQTDLYSGSTT